jgi:hypothetical protein
MKTETKLPLIGVSIAIFFIILITFAVYPSNRFWLTEEEQNLEWCRINKPMYNESCFDGIISPDCRVQEQCFGKLWHKYCWMSYPSYCPKNSIPYEVEE